MASINGLLRQYPIVDRICYQLRHGELRALARINADSRQELKGLGRPTNTAPFRPVSRSCLCKSQPSTCCPRHGTPTLRNLLSKTDRACEDRRHRDRPSLRVQYLEIWVAAICDGLGGPGNINTCRMCNINVSFICGWLDSVTKDLHWPGGGRSQRTCGTCWRQDFEELRADARVQLGPSRIGHKSLKEAQKSAAFCDCGPVVLCSECKPSLAEQQETEEVQKTLGKGFHRS